MFGKKMSYGKMEKDPVCGMNVETTGSKSKEYMGKTYYFCSSDCQNEFDANPQKYAGNSMGNQSHGCC